MRRDHVISTNISSVGYDEQAGILEIEFNSGGIYQYSSVPKNVYMGLMSATSHGSYFHQHIEDAYSYIKVR